MDSVVVQGDRRNADGPRRLGCWLTLRLVFVVGLGIYLSSVVKDIACTPRPFAPPVTRLCE